jgi:hypothetical protein
MSADQLNETRLVYCGDTARPYQWFVVSPTGVKTKIGPRYSGEIAARKGLEKLRAKLSK